MKLIYIIKMGRDYKGFNLYQFLFSSHSRLGEVSGDYWGSNPCNSSPESPNNFVTKAYNLLMEGSLEMIQDNITFCMQDCKQGIIPLAWEEDYNELEFDTRLNFKWAEEYNVVYDKLYERNLTLLETLNI